MVTVSATSVFALNTQKFSPVLGQTHVGLLNHGALGLNPFDVEASFYLSFLHNALELGVAQNNLFADEVAEHFLTGHFQFGIGVHERLTLRVAFPMNFYSKVEAPSTSVQTQDVSIGDVKLDATITILGLKNPELAFHEDRPWGLSLVPFMTVALQNSDDFFGDEHIAGGAKLVVDKYMGKRHYLGLNAGIKFRKTEQILNLQVGHEFVYGASYVWRMSIKSKWDAVLDIVGSTTVKKFFAEEISSPYEAFLSIRKRSKNDRWSWVAGAGQGGNNGYGAPDYHVYSGLSYRFMGEAKAKSLAAPEPVSPKIQEAPTQAPKENYEDQLDSYLDQQSTSPAPVVIPDRGYLDVRIEDDQGNPLMISFDIQKKGEQDYTRLTSNRVNPALDPGIYKGQVTYQGRRIELDFEIKPGETTGKIIVFEKGKRASAPVLQYIQPIYFEVNKASIKPESLITLDRVARMVQEHAGIEEINIKAHTNSHGLEDYNLILSNQRADSVKRYLGQRGINTGMIRTYGYGQSQPKGPNTRVEFELKGRNLNIKIVPLN